MAKIKFTCTSLFLVFSSLFITASTSEAQTGNVTEGTTTTVGFTTTTSAPVVESTSTSTTLFLAPPTVGDTTTTVVAAGTDATTSTTVMETLPETGIDMNATNVAMFMILLGVILVFGVIGSRRGLI